MQSISRSWFSILPRILQPRWIIHFAGKWNLWSPCTITKPTLHTYKILKVEYTHPYRIIWLSYKTWGNFYLQGYIPLLWNANVARSERQSAFQFPKCSCMYTGTNLYVQLSLKGYIFKDISVCCFLHGHREYNSLSKGIQSHSSHDLIAFTLSALLNRLCVSHNYGKQPTPDLCRALGKASEPLWCQNGVYPSPLESDILRMLKLLKILNKPLLYIDPGFLPNHYTLLHDKTI